MIEGLKKKDEFVKERKKEELKGLFKPKVTTFIPASIKSTFKRGPEATRDVQVIHSKSPIASRRTTRQEKTPSRVNLAKVTETKRKEVAHSLIGGAE